MEEFRGSRRCFDFKVYSDGYAFTAQFTGHFFFLQLRLDPKMYRNETYYVDLGRSQCFTAMKGISGPGNPNLIIKLSNGEYKHMASVKLLEKARHGLKVENFAPLIL